LAEKYGIDVFEAHKEYLFDSTENMMKAEIHTIPNGVYHGEATVYYDGKTPGSKYQIRVKITVEDETITFDYSETDPQTDGFVNGTYTSSASATLLTFLQMVNPDMPHNDGMIRPVNIIIPEGTILNAKYPAATTFGNHLCPPNADAIMRALSQAIPDRITAGWNQLLCYLTTGFDARKSNNYVDIGFLGLKGGSGATKGVDGYDHIGMIDASGGVLDQDYEMFEQQTPHLLLRHEYWQDSAGAGQWRGGLGVETEFKIGGKQTKVVTFGDGDVEPAFGLFAGKNSTLNKIELHHADGKVYKTTTKDLVENVPAGTILFQQAGGGGGYGNPHLRKAGKVAREVRDGIISIRQARESYGVVVDPETFAVDVEKTSKLRKGEK
jgi:N-methylhydantoinase B